MKTVIPAPLRLCTKVPEPKFKVPAFDTSLCKPAAVTCKVEPLAILIPPSPFNIAPSVSNKLELSVILTIFCTIEESSDRVKSFLTFNVPSPVIPTLDVTGVEILIVPLFTKPFEPATPEISIGVAPVNVTLVSDAVALTIAPSASLFDVISTSRKIKFVPSLSNSNNEWSPA